MIVIGCIYITLIFIVIYKVRNRTFDNVIKKIKIYDNKIFNKIYKKYKIVYDDKQAIIKTKRILNKCIIFIIVIILIFSLILIYVGCVNKEEGKNILVIDRGRFLEGNKDIRLKACINNKDLYIEKEFDILIKEEEPTDKQIVDRLYNVLNVKMIIGDNDSLNEIKYKLLLPTKNDYGASIEWNTDSKLVDIQTGEIKRLPNNIEKEWIEIRACIKKGKESKIKSFDLCIVKNDKFIYRENLKERLNFIVKSLNEQCNSKIILPTEVYKEKINWKEINNKDDFLNNLVNVCIILILVGSLSIYNNLYKLKKKIKEKKERVNIEFYSLLNKFLLLCTAGLNIRECFLKIELDLKNDSILKKELKRVNDSINIGCIEINAYREFAKRFNNININKFISIIIQGILKGINISEHLIRLNDQMNIERQSNIKVLAEKASTKLIIPLVLIFIAIMLLVIYPAISMLKI